MADYLRFDPSEDIVVSLELAAHLLTNRDVSPTLRWKWIIVATHDALQGAYRWKHLKCFCPLFGIRTLGT